MNGPPAAPPGDGGAEPPARRPRTAPQQEQQQQPQQPQPQPQRPVTPPLPGDIDRASLEIELDRALNAVKDAAKAKSGKEAAALEDLAVLIPATATAVLIQVVLEDLGIAPLPGFTASSDPPEVLWAAIVRAAEKRDRLHVKRQRGDAWAAYMAANMVRLGELGQAAEAAKDKGDTPEYTRLYYVWSALIKEVAANIEAGPTKFEWRDGEVGAGAEEEDDDEDDEDEDEDE